MTRIFASSLAIVRGSSVEPDGGGAFEGKTCGSVGIVGSSGGARVRSGGGSGRGSGRGVGGGRGGRGNGSVGIGGRSWPQARPARLHGSMVVLTASRSASALPNDVERCDLLDSMVRLLLVRSEPARCGEWKGQ